MASNKEGAGAQSKTSRKDRFNPEDTTKQGNNITTINVDKRPPVGDPGKLEGAASQQQAATEKEQSNWRPH